jgi:hypothetical protein
MLSSRTAPEMKAARERPGTPICTDSSAKNPSYDMTGDPKHLTDSIDRGTKGTAKGLRCALLRAVFESSGENRALRRLCSVRPSS